LTEERRDAIFKMFDVEDTGFIRHDDIKKAFHKLGKTITDDEIQEIFAEYDANNDGVIDREEWRSVMDEIIEAT